MKQHSQTAVSRRHATGLFALCLTLALSACGSSEPASGGSPSPPGGGGPGQPPAVPADCGGTFCAGAASVDMTGHTGEGQGQLGTTDFLGLTTGKFDPFFHATLMAPTDGIQSRQYAKAAVLQGSDGVKIAIAKTDTYIPTSVLSRRVVQLVTGADPLMQDFVVDDLDDGAILLASTHNHSAPHYVSTAIGHWIFADTLDVRAFERTARRIAEAIQRADAARQPARVAAAGMPYRSVQHNIIGRSVADDGSPAGFPRDYFDDELAVIRVEARASGEPIAAIVNFGMHPETIDSGADMISSDFVGVVEREVEIALGRAPDAAEGSGPVVVWTQGGLGDQEPEQSRATPAAEGNEFFRRGFAQMEILATRLAHDGVLRLWQDIGNGTPAVPARFVAFTDDPVIGAAEYRYNGPILHSLPTVSNCRAEEGRIPILGFPDCEEVPLLTDLLGPTLSGLRQIGLPIPDNISPPALQIADERASIHLQAFRIDEILLGTCPCEPLSDMALNFKSRADRITDNIHKGFVWPCEDNGSDELMCNFRQADFDDDDWRPVPRAAVERMRAHVLNDADGWEEDFLSLQGELEPDDPTEIYGNFTHRELAPEEGFTLPLMVGMANDYIGYVVTNREYQRGDHYRKALTAYGPYTADYINTRLLAMARELRGGEPAWRETEGVLDQTLSGLDSALLELTTHVFGAVGTLGLGLYDNLIPDDGGEPGNITQPPEAVVERFGAAMMRWDGGSNWTDNPRVHVERLDTDGDWAFAESQEGGAVVLTLAYPGLEGLPAWLAGNLRYEWTATWEVFDATPVGTYRFVVQGHARSGGAPEPYRIESEAFDVVPWRGLTATDLESDGGAVRFRVAGEEARIDEERFPGPIALDPGLVRYPFSYDGPPYIDDSSLNTSGPFRYCFNCSFRPWARHGEIDTVQIEARNGDGTTVAQSQASFDGERWRVDGLPLGDAVELVIPAGGIRDRLGNINGEAIRLALP